MFKRKSTKRETIIPLKNVLSCNIAEGDHIILKYTEDGQETSLTCSVTTLKGALEVEAKINYAIVLARMKVDDKQGGEEDKSDVQYKCG